MFKKFFSKRKKSSERNLFDELFPLSETHKQTIENSVNEILIEMTGKDSFEELKNYTRNYESQEFKFQSLKFNSLSWKIAENNSEQLVFISQTGDSMQISVINPNGKLEKNETEINVYKTWIRNLFIQQQGGLISCDNVITPNRIDLYETIGKIPREDGPGIDYIYFLNIRNYQEQKLYQIWTKVLEMNPTGLRDNIIMHPICDITGLDMGKVSELYRQDPYDKNISDGNRRNLSEMKDFDYLFPFHPLSIIRKEIKPALLNSLKF